MKGRMMDVYFDVRANTNAGEHVPEAALTGITDPRVTHVVLPARRAASGVYYVTKNSDNPASAPMTLAAALELLHARGLRGLVRDDSEWRAAVPEWEIRQVPLLNTFDAALDEIYVPRAWSRMSIEAQRTHPSVRRVIDAMDITASWQVGEMASGAAAVVDQAAAPNLVAAMRGRGMTIVMRALTAESARLAVEAGADSLLVRDVSLLDGVVDLPAEIVDPVPEGETVPAVEGHRGHGEWAWVSGWWRPVVRAGRPARVRVLDTDDARVGVVPYGATSWAEMIARDGFTVAHRGGSLDWHEHTMEAYSQAVSRGVDALEISCHRTKDGVWIASHDASLENVSGPKGKNVADLTYQEIKDWYQAFPYMMPVTLRELMDAYGESHVIVADPKNSAEQIDEMLSLLEPIKARVGIKFFWDAAWLFPKARAAGFGTWAYAYNASAEDSTWQQQVTAGYADVIAVECNAPQAMMDHVTGSPCVLAGHIVAEPDDWRMARRGGCRGVMVSGVGRVMPVRG